MHVESNSAAPTGVAPAASSSVSVQFFTKCDYPPGSVPDTAFAVPIAVTTEGLTALVNELLNQQPHVPLDFLINDQYITGTLEKFMRRKGFTPEDVLQIEYKPALQAEEGSKLPHDDWVASVRAPLCGVSTCIVTAAYDHCVRVWDGDDCLAIGAGHDEVAKGVAIRRCGAAIDASGKQASAKRGAKAAAASKRRGRGEEGGVIPSFIEFASCGKDGLLAAWRFDGAAKTLTKLGSASQHVDGIDTVDVDPTGDMVATGSWDCAVKVFHWSDLITSNESPKTAALTAAMPGTKRCAPLVSFTDHARAVTKVLFSPAFETNRVLYSTGLDGCVKVWNVATAQLLTTLEASHASYGMCVKPAGSGSDMIVTGNTDGRLRLFDVRTKSGAVQTWSGHRQWVYGVTWFWRPDENGQTAAAGDSPLLASAGEDSSVRVWDMRSTGGQALLTLDTLHSEGVLDVSYAGNNEIVSCGKDNRAKSFKVDDASNSRLKA